MIIFTYTFRSFSVCQPSPRVVSGVPGLGLSLPYTHLYRCFFTTICRGIFFAPICTGLLVAGQVHLIFSLSEHPAVSGKGTKRGWLWPTDVAEDNLGLLEDLISEIGNNEDLLEVVV